MKADVRATSNLGGKKAANSRGCTWDPQVVGGDKSETSLLPGVEIETSQRTGSA